MTSTVLAPRTHHLAAANALSRAAKARRFAKLYPHTAEQEAENERFWRTSYAMHRNSAEVAQAVRVWKDPTQVWLQELDRIIARHAGLCGVE